MNLEDKRGQMGFGFIMGIVMLVVAVMLITAFWPTIQDSFDVLRNQDELNCKSNTDICGGVGSDTICYNETVGNSHAVTCSMLSIGPPLILIMLILGAVGLIAASGRQQQQPAYPGY
ncbi:unnamed protein product [marine sediment metagenome]|uniref:Uncharacterized protein n=1 Tax=marine sediment metagenome TaxID=412755 RepID=X0ST95_9ZZZZ